MTDFICSICQPLIMFFDISKLSFLSYLPTLLYALLANVARIPKCHFCLPSPSLLCGGETFCFLHFVSALAFYIT